GQSEPKLRCIQLIPIMATSVVICQHLGKIRFTFLRYLDSRVWVHLVSTRARLVGRNRRRRVLYEPLRTRRITPLSLVPRQYLRVDCVRIRDAILRHRHRLRFRRGKRSLLSEAGCKGHPHHQTNNRDANQAICEAPSSHAANDSSSANAVRPVASFHNYEVAATGRCEEEEASSSWLADNRFHHQRIGIRNIHSGSTQL